MSYQVIARKYRPQRFADIIGQEHITRTLQNAIAAGRLHHAYLFTGIRGIGKTTLARIFAKALNCQNISAQQSPEPCNECSVCKDITAGSSIDVQEIDGASNNGVDEVREIRERVKYLPSGGKYKIYIIDEVHMLTTQAFNALLKTLEEPPSHAIFIFATTESQKIPATILSRCQRYDFRRISVAKIIETLKAIAVSEGVEADEDALEIIAAEAEGSMRDAESLFDQAIAYSGKKLTFEHLKGLLGFLDRAQIEACVNGIVDKNAAAVLQLSNGLFSSGENLTRFVVELLDVFHALLVTKSSGASFETPRFLDSKTLTAVAAKVSLEDCQRWFNIIYRGAEEMSRTKFPKFMLDSILVNMVAVADLIPLSELLEKVEALASSSVTESASGQKLRASVLQQPAARPSFGAGTPSNAPRPADTSHVGKEERKPTPQSENVAPQRNGLCSEFLDWLKLNKPQVAAFLELCNEAEVRDSTLVIKFANRSFASERILEEDRKAFVEKLASDFFRRPMKISVVFASEVSQLASAKKQQFEEEATKERAMRQEALTHESIREAANIFNAEIKEIKPKA